MATVTVPQLPERDRSATFKWTAATSGLLALWVVLYRQLVPFSEWVVS